MWQRIRLREWNRRVQKKKNDIFVPFSPEAREIKINRLSRGFLAIRGTWGGDPVVVGTSQGQRITPEAVPSLRLGVALNICKVFIRPSKERACILYRNTQIHNPGAQKLWGGGVEILSRRQTRLSCLLGGNCLRILKGRVFFDEEEKRRWHEPPLQCTWTWNSGRVWIVRQNKVVPMYAGPGSVDVQ